MKKRSKRDPGFDRVDKRPRQGLAWVYILECGDGSLYVGATSDIERRLLEHQTGKGGRYTRSHQPVQLRFALQCQSFGDAMRREAEIRHWQREKKKQLVGLWPMDEHGRVRPFASFV